MEGKPVHEPLLPTTTEQEDITTAGQRKINLVWEYTQAVIALVVTISTMVAGVVGAILNKPEPVPTILSVAFGTVVGFYFSRTNHSSIGGVGKQPDPPPYRGR